MTDARQITRRAKSNLAVALRILPQPNRDDMSVFYAFCRHIDDLADEPGLPAETKRAALDTWSRGLAEGFEHPDELQGAITEIRSRHAIPNELLLAIVDGCRSDVDVRRFATWEELDAYIWKVSCAVGLVSVRIFGCRSPGADAYAEALGRALQLTNIARDVGEDWRNERRLYLPLELLDAHGLRENELPVPAADPRFQAVMAQLAARAEAAFAEAERRFPAADRRPLAPARIMGDIYRNLLARMRRDGFQVFGKRYRVPAAAKAIILARHFIAARLPLGHAIPGRE